MPKTIRLYRLTNETIYVYKCGNCNKEIRRNSRTGNRWLYCSDQCRNIVKNKSVILKRKCKECKNEIVVKNKVRKKDRTFCSRACQAQWKQKKTLERIEQIKEFSSMGFHVYEIAKRLKINYSPLHQFMQNHNLMGYVNRNNETPGNTYKYWSETELFFLKNHMDHSGSYCSNYLKRSIQSVQSMKHKIRNH